MLLSSCEREALKNFEFNKPLLAINVAHVEGGGGEKERESRLGVGTGKGVCLLANWKMGSPR